MKYQFKYQTDVWFSAEVGIHNVLLRCQPAAEEFQHVSRQTFTINEGFWHNEGCDGQGNRVISAGTTMLHSHLGYCSSGVVEMDTYCVPDGNPHAMYRQNSSLTMPTREMLNLTPRLSGIFLDDCLNIMHRVHQHIVYTPGATNILTTASDVFLHRKGVCQDYAHLMIAICRNAGMSARYVCGLMMGEGQTHAWVEVNDGQNWYAFDPTNDNAIATGYIKLAHGRDALDCPVSRGMYQGLALQRTMVSVTVKEL